VAAVCLTAYVGLASAQEALPERFRPPVHIRPASAGNVLRATATEDLYGDQDESEGLRWQTANQNSRRPTAPPADNAVYDRRVEHGETEILRGELITDDQERVELSAPIDDPFGDREVSLRTEHGEPAANPSRTRSPGGRRGFAAGYQDQGDLADPYQGRSQDEKPQGDDSGEEPRETTCEEFRQQLLNQSISQLEINVSAPRPTDSRTERSLPARSWTDRYGAILGQGTLVELRHGYAIIDTGTGRQSIAIARLSDEDLGVIAQVWRVPSECTLGDVGAVDRCWMAMTYTWKASNLCHKPLYFEDEQLERYGHSAGPILQPLKSTAHFFVRTITLPYQMGIHPANECQYALGFYRPGNCAPWLCDPIPLSLSGARHEATAALAAGFILP
jgi:hypothetical protein